MDLSQEEERMEKTMTPGQVAYEAYRAILALSFPMDFAALPDTCQFAWAAAAQAVRDAGLPVRQRERAWCTVCQQPLDAGAVYCPDHPQSDIMVVLRDAAGGQGPWPCQTLAGEEDTP
jgi:hypothetical protein